MPKQTLTLEAVTLTNYVSGRVPRPVTLATFEGAPYRLAKRSSFAYSKGLRFVKALGASSAADMPYIAVVDSQRRILAAWRSMPGGLPGYTGTHDKDPLIGSRSMFWRRNG